MSSIEAERASPGAPRHGVFGGVLEGAVGDAAALRAAVARIPSVRHDLNVDGGRFSLLFDDAPVAGDALDTDAQDALLDALADVARAAAPDRPLESNLRATLVHADRVVETLFTVEVRAGERVIAPISRERPLAPGDDVAARGGAGDGGLDAPFRGMSRGRRAILLALVVAAGALGAWQTGALDLARSALDRTAAEDVARDTGPFLDALSVTVERSLGAWTCRVERGPDFPATPSALDARIAAAPTLAERAAARAAGEGGRAWLRGLDAEGRVVDAAPIDLRPLTAEEDGRAEAHLGPLHRITSVVVALTPGTDAETP